MEASNKDVLGVASEEFGMQSEAFGQYFTPHSAAVELAEIQAVGPDPEPPVTIADPACGSGRLLVLAARTHDVRTICFGQDKDPLCAQIAALNFCFFNLDGVVVCGDSLRMETRRAWQTQHTVCGSQVREVDPETVPWSDTAFEEESKVDSATRPTDTSETTSDRLTVEQGEEALTQADLGNWLDTSPD